MHAEEAVNRCGGRASWQMLRALGVRRTSLETALRQGRVVRTRRGQFRSSGLDTALDAAIAVTGVLSHRSAALHLGLEVATAPEKPEVIVRRNRNLSPAHRARVSPFYRNLAASEVRQGVTTPVRTVLDCARDLPYAEALVVADSALRREVTNVDQLRRAARALRGPRSAAAARVAGTAHVRSANVFESSLRAIALDAGLDVVPQTQVTDRGLFAMVDLADEGRRLVIEAESFEFHATRRGFRRDVRRYTELAVFGWTVLRFTWEDVTLQPHYVRWALESWRRWHDLGSPVGPPPAHLPRLA
jgi:very-short-patch-repair endonuclease